MRQTLRSLSGLFFIALAYVSGPVGPAAAVVSSTSARPFLLDTVEFRGIPIGGWYAFSDKVAEALDMLARCQRSPETCPNSDVAAVLAETATLSGRPRTEILAAVNRLVNRRPYRADRDTFGSSEHWASPLEFLAKSGDCEDYAILKYALLRHLGLPADLLRVVLVRREADGLGHAVVAAYLGDKVYILDSASAAVRRQSEVSGYTALFSFNERARWAHVATAATASSVPGGDGSPAAAGPDVGGTAAIRGVEADPFLRIYVAAFSSPRPGPGEYRVQLGAFRSLANANDLWQRVWRSEWDLLGRTEPRVYDLDRGADGPLHLLQVGRLEGERHAQALCRALAQRGLDCLVVRPGPTAAATDQT